MTKQRPIQKQISLREAEGYLDLLHFAAPLLKATEPVRNRVARRALAALDRVGDYGAWSSHALYLRGQALRALESYHEAVIPLREAAELERENIHIWLSLGWCLKRCGRIDAAIEALEEALAVEPGTAILHYNLACYWSLAKNASRAVGYLSRAFELEGRYRDLVATEPDFDPIREHPQFQSLTTAIV